MILRDIPKYEEFCVAVEELKRSCASLQQFDDAIKSEKYIRLRNGAREELQSIYDTVCSELKLPNIPVHFPKRKKVRIRGQAHSICGTSTEIRIYPIEGPIGVPYDQWIPQHLNVCTKRFAFEILKHEIAHVIALNRNGRVDNHDEDFVVAYDVINNYFKVRGFENLIDPDLELWGVPLDSYAARIAQSRSAAWIKKISSAPQGCMLPVTLLASVLFIMLIALIVS